MTTKEIADTFVSYLRANEEQKAYDELYSPDIISIENPITPNENFRYMEITGMQAKMEKNKTWESMVHEMHEMRVSDPLVADNAFAVTFYMDMSYTSDKREQSTELATFWVKDGKIVREELVY